MTDVEAMVQRYYGDRPLLPRIDEALRADRVDSQTPSYRDLWPYDQLHSRGIVGTQEHAERRAYGLVCTCSISVAASAVRLAISQPNAVAGWRRSTSRPTSSK